MAERNLSIIIIAYNEEKFIHTILSSLSNQTLKNFEVVVIDSNSIDRTADIAKSFADNLDEFVYYKLDAAYGPAYARNKGAELAKYERILFLDADTDIEYSFIEITTNEINRRHIDVATCPIRILEKSPVSNYGAYFLNTFMYLLYPVYTTAYGACIFSTKKIHEEVNGFDENLDICEDCNYVKKARRILNYRFGILKPYFYTSDRRSKTEGGVLFMLTYIKIHLYRMLTNREIVNRSIKYEYGTF